MTALYRSVSNSPAPNKIHTMYTTMRAPGNVPYVVDNIWEWLRPEELLSRRTAVFASPKPESAFASAPNGSVHEVVFQGGASLCQLSEGRGFDNSDAKFHTDCRAVPKLILKHLGQSWIDSDIKSKNDAGRLFTPCLYRHEVESLFQSCLQLRMLAEELEEKVSFWNHIIAFGPHDPVPDLGGEIFFHAPDGFMLHPATTQEKSTAASSLADAVTYLMKDLTPSERMVIVKRFGLTLPEAGENT